MSPDADGALASARSGSAGLQTFEEGKQVSGGRNAQRDDLRVGQWLGWTNLLLLAWILRRALAAFPGKRSSTVQ
jgi:hypothetical protein